MQSSDGKFHATDCANTETEKIEVGRGLNPRAWRSSDSLVC